MSKINVLYVEDEPSIADLLTSGLDLFNIRVYPLYTSAEELLENINKPEYAEADMLLFDIRLPKMTGLQLAGKLRENGEQRPFMLVSAWPPPTEETLSQLNAAFQPKPFAFMDVVQTIQKLVNKS